MARKGKEDGGPPPSKKKRESKPALPTFNAVESTIPTLGLEGKGENVYSILSNCILVTGEGGSDSTVIGATDGGHILLDDPDEAKFPVMASTSLDSSTVQDKDISQLSLYNLLKGPFGVGAGFIFESKKHAIEFLEQVRFKTYDSQELRVAKLKEFYRYMASKGVGGLPVFPVHLINQVPFPQAHSSYPGGGNIRGKIALSKLS